MAGFLFRLELAGGTPADPPTFETAVPTWRPGDTIPLGRRELRVVALRDDDAAASGAGRGGRSPIGSNRNRRLTTRGRS
jgi:hypothetical protein